MSTVAREADLGEWMERALARAQVARRSGETILMPAVPVVFASRIAAGVRDAGYACEVLEPPMDVSSRTLRISV